MKEREIGGPFILGADKRGCGLNINCDKQYTYFINSCRNALAIILDFIKPQRAFVCCYNCDTVILPFLDRNIDLEFFNIDKKFQIDLDFFKYLGTDTTPTLVYIQNYFCNYQLEMIKNELRKYNVIIVEDITHCLLDDLKFENADFYIASARKWSGTGDGGLLYTNAILDNLQQNDNEIINNYKKIIPLQQKYITNREPALKEVYRSITTQNEKLFYIKKPQTISAYGKTIIETTDYEYIKLKRRENFDYLVKRLNSFEFLELPINYREQNATPLYLPIYTKKRTDLQQFLFKYHIYLPILWPKTCICGNCSHVVETIYENILCIPVDQRYSVSDMERIISALSDFQNSF